RERGCRLHSHPLGGRLEQAALALSMGRHKMLPHTPVRPHFVATHLVKERMSFTIGPLHVPERIDAPNAQEWHDYVALVNTVIQEDSESHYFDGEAGAWLAGYQHQEYNATHPLAARDADGSLVGI